MNLSVPVLLVDNVQKRSTVAQLQMRRWTAGQSAGQKARPRGDKPERNEMAFGGSDVESIINPTTTLSVAIYLLRQSQTNSAVLALRSIANAQIRIYFRRSRGCISRNRG